MLPKLLPAKLSFPDPVIRCSTAVSVSISLAPLIVLAPDSCRLIERAIR
jgi:hypothetical protein